MSSRTCAKRYNRSLLAGVLSAFFVFWLLSAPADSAPAATSLRDNALAPSRAAHLFPLAVNSAPAAAISTFVAPVVVAPLAAAATSREMPRGAPSSAEVLADLRERLLAAAAVKASAAGACGAARAPLRKEEWDASWNELAAADARFERAVSTFSTNFAATTVVNVGQNTVAPAAGRFPHSKTAAPPLAEGTLGGVRGGVLAVGRALAALNGAAIFAVSSSADSASSRDIAAALAELDALAPPVVRDAIRSATHDGAFSLGAALEHPLAVFLTLVAASSDSSSAARAGSVFLLRGANTARLSSVMSLRGEGGDGSKLALEDFIAVSCAWAPQESIDVYQGVLRWYPTRRVLPIPPDLPPAALYDEFTMGGEVYVTYEYYNEAVEPGGERLGTTYTRDKIESWTGKARRRETNYYGATDTYLYNLLSRHAELVRGKRVVVMGSLEPWYEIIALEFGSSGVSTVEYSPRKAEDPRFTFYTPSDMNARIAAGTWERFDVALSISSFEHDGLGRYGDPLGGEADVATIRTVATSVLKPGGHLILALPVGGDCVVYNAHRVYGKKRLALIEKGWTRVDAEGPFGSDIDRVINEGSCYAWHQPILLLKNAA